MEGLSWVVPRETEALLPILRFDNARFTSGSRDLRGPRLVRHRRPGARRRDRHHSRSDRRRRRYARPADVLR